MQNEPIVPLADSVRAEDLYIADQGFVLRSTIIHLLFACRAWTQFLCGTLAHEVPALRYLAKGGRILRCDPIALALVSPSVCYFVASDVRCTHP